MRHSIVILFVCSFALGACNNRDTALVPAIPVAVSALSKVQALSDCEPYSEAKLLAKSLNSGDLTDEDVDAQKKAWLEHGCDKKLDDVKTAQKNLQNFGEIK